LIFNILIFSDAIERQKYFWLENEPKERQKSFLTFDGLIFDVLINLFILDVMINLKKDFQHFDPFQIFDQLVDFQHSDF
jgi:hypothetical protein